jgi:hypothetical protein
MGKWPEQSKRVWRPGLWCAMEYYTVAERSQVHSFRGAEASWIDAEPRVR